MTLANTIATPTEMLPPPANGNGAGTVPAEVVQAAAAAVDSELSKKLAAIESIGKQIRQQERKKSKQETVVAEAKSALDTEREALHKIEHYLEELHDELATLAVGKNSERLPFGEAKADSVVKESLTTQTEAWRSVALSTLTPKIKPAKLKVLAENNPPITTLGELSDWQAKKGEFWSRDLKGLGDGGREQIEKAAEAYYAANPVPTIQGSVERVKKTLIEATESIKDRITGVSDDTAPFDDAAIKMETAEGIIKLPGVCFIDVAQTVGGPYAVRYSVQFGKHRCVAAGVDEKGISEWMRGHPSRVHAIAAAADEIFDFVKAHQVKGLSGKAKRQASEVMKAIDALDKKLAQEVKGDGVADDVKAYWEARPNRNAGDPTPREADGKPKRFRGNKGK